MQPKPIKNLYLILLAASFAGIFLSCQHGPGSDGEQPFDTPHQVSQSPITKPQSPAESLKSFRLPKGYRLEIVASEPTINEPVAIAWDGNGRMYIAQMDTYMQTIDAKGQYESGSKIMLLEDTDDDGVMDKSSVFKDNLTAPRMILAVGHELFVNETNSYSIHAYEDTDGDGIADKKRTVYHHPKKAYGNIEHQRSGLDWNLDNWIYVTTDPVRFKYQQGQLVVDTLVSGSNGQWGLTHDDFGRLYFSRAASGMAATGFQINPVYGQLDLENAWDEKFGQIWPAIKTPDVNGGPKTLREDSTMFGFTSVTGQSVFRGDRLPENFKGNYFVAEPVGRFIRRAILTDVDGIITLKNAYHQDEFITSTDMNFRPVNTYTGPDGCLYIIDMYRGIIQESTWAQPGSFLYDQIISKGLDKNFGRGRIYRLVNNDMPRGKRPALLDASTDDLVSYLGHPNGWWRDNAQRELIIRGDQSVTKMLKEKATTAANALERLHALWTLEGLNALDKKTIITLLDDRDAQVLKSAIRLSEPFANQSDTEVLDKLGALSMNKSRDVRSQLLLSLSLVQAARQMSIVKKVIDTDPNDPLMLGIQSSLQKTDEARKFGYRLSSLEPHVRQSITEGARIFRSVCASCHGSEGTGFPTEIAPPLISKFKLIEYKDEVIKIMLHGLKGPVDGRNYTEQMVPMGTNSDEWIASVLSYVRYDLCMRSFPQMGQGYINWVVVTPDQVKNVRELNLHRKVPWTWDELHGIRNRAD